MTIFIQVLAAIGIIFVLSLLEKKVDRKEEEWKKLERLEKEKEWWKGRRTNKEVIKMLNRDKITNDNEK